MNRHDGRGKGPAPQYGGAPRGVPGDCGVGEGGEPADEREHFYTCAHCDQSVDMRDLYAVLHHEQAEHDPLPVEGSGGRSQ